MLGFSSTTTWDMKGLDEFVKKCKEIERHEIQVGFDEEMHPDANMPMGNLAWILENGADLPNGEIPPRQFMESTNFQFEVDNNRLAPLVIRAILYRDAPINKQLMRLGKKEKEVMQQVMRMKLFPFPNNAKSTIEKKGRDDALIDTQKFIKSIKVKVHKTGSIKGDTPIKTGD